MFARALEFGALGMMADQFLAPITQGRGGFLGALIGLFTPDASDMDTASRRGGGLGILEGLFGNTFGRPEDPPATSRPWSPLAKVAAVALGATLFSTIGSGTPLYGSWLAGLTPYNLGGYIPLAWSNGLIPNWGMMAGFGP
jgi:hypothetical protein